MKKIITFFVFSVMLSLAKGQDCRFYLPAVQGAQLEYKNFDKKNKLTGSSRQFIKDIKKGPQSISAIIETEYFDAKGNSQGNAEMEARCEKGIFYIDMKNYLNQQSLGGYKDMEMSIEGGSLEMPSLLHAGDALKPGDMKMSFSANGMTLMTMTVSISNRKVEAIEEVTTDAGTFTCYKITYNITTKNMGFSVSSKGVEYYNDDIGLVKSEAYDSKGELLSTTILSALKK